VIDDKGPIAEHSDHARTSELAGLPKPELGMDRRLPGCPGTCHLQGNDHTVENVTLINSYNGIRIGPEGNVRHRIRSVYGCVLRRGILVDNCSDIGRIENVQFHCHWWSAPEVGGAWNPVHKFMWENCEAFIFGRTDWEYVNNTFVFPVNIGYHVVQTQAGAPMRGIPQPQFCFFVRLLPQQHRPGEEPGGVPGGSGRRTLAGARSRDSQRAWRRSRYRQ
jgi:hypothetical protein